MTVQLTIRYFAAARAAAGTDEQIIAVEPGTTIAALVDRLGADKPEFAKVLQRCSFLLDGVATRDRDTLLDGAGSVDVLPPFAGG